MRMMETTRTAGTMDAAERAATEVVADLNERRDGKVYYWINPHEGKLGWISIYATSGNGASHRRDEVMQITFPAAA